MNRLFTDIPVFKRWNIDNILIVIIEGDVHTVTKSGQREVIGDLWRADKKFRQIS